jgi:SAM-dependent methyltransferase
MEVDAETLFNALGKRYEDAYADSPELIQVTDYVVSRLPPSSRVLDVGCGTGKPVAAALASAGHAVYGIDVAENMVKIAASQVPGTFLKADMRTYTPPVKMDAVFAIYSLFQIPPSDTHKMVYRFAEWLKEDGILVLGAAPSSALAAGNGVHDPVWDCMRIEQTWMERPVYELYFSRTAWLNLLRGAGFVIELEKMFNYVPKDPKHKRSETHFLIVGRKTESRPLLGPYPLPEGLPANSMRNDSAWRRLQGHLFVANDERIKLSSMLEVHQKVLDIGGGLKGELLMHSFSINADFRPSQTS